MLAYRAGEPILVRQFLADVARVAAALPAAGHVLNVCADRYRFTVGFCAGLVRGLVSLLPPTRTPAVIAELRSFAPDAICLTDEQACDIELPQVRYPEAPAAVGAAAAATVPLIDAGRRCAWVFTSGSTGTPVPHEKTFGRMMDCMGVEAARLGLPQDRSCALIATVPPQHMYGLEASVLLPLASGHALCAGHPFYPADICAALEAVPRPRVLVSTPIHLRALLASGLTLPEVDLVVSATAPLATQLAAEVERRCATRLLEIYGSTETGSIAVRQPTATAEWWLWPGVTLESRGEESFAAGGHIERPTRLYDLIEVTAPDRFLLHGRVAELVNIAGKRSSLGYLNHQLNSIPGVLDGAFFHAPPGPAGEVARLGACVVAPGLDAAAIAAELRLRIDPVFLPRPLLLVASLPRTSTGKLPQEALRALAAQARQSTAA